MINSEPCPCGKIETYQSCCQPLHQGEKKADSAEQLMRSRYSAFSKGQIDYLLATHHPSRRNEVDLVSLQKTLENCQWLKLEILAVEASDNNGFVEFVAYFKEKAFGALRERSRFKKADGQWFYLDGEQKKPDFPGRNDPCWCDSGKKSKKCHGVMG